MFAHGDLIDVIRRAPDGRDSDGNTVYSETVETVRGAFDPAIGFERTNGQDQVSVQPQALLPPGTQVNSGDALVIRGKRYEVDGDPNDWRSPFTGWNPGVQVPLKRVVG